MEESIANILLDIQDKLTLEGKKSVFEDNNKLTPYDLKETYPAEEFTREFLIDKILFDSFEVKRTGPKKFLKVSGEYRTVDYAVQSGQIRVLIEAKPINADLFEKSDQGAVNQIKGVFRLAQARDNFDFGIATDGLRWVFISKDGQQFADLDIRRDFSQIKNFFITTQPVRELQLEDISKKFYEEYNDLLHGVKKISKKDCLVNSILNVDDEDDREEIAQILVDRLIFIKFLQSKGIIKSDVLDYLCDLPEYELNLKLNQLFFEVMNKEEENRESIDPHFSSIPYLNGSLFEKIDVERRNHDYRVKAAILKKVITFLQKFRFVHLESLENDMEVIDPEILGYIFERSMTAQDRKGTGAYYTPKEIAQFMAESAIFPVLLRKVNHYLRYEKNYNEADLLSDLECIYDVKGPTLRDVWEHVILRIKICDNACGSGAFLLAAAKTLFLFNKKVLDELSEYSRASDIALKKLILNCLYGTDINPRAIEIAKLRLWLWLAESYDPGLVEPLPNIEYNLRIGNSLFGYVDIEQFKTDEVTLDDFRESKETLRLLLKQFVELKDKYRTAMSSEARRLKQEIEKIKDMITNKLNYELFRTIVTEHNNWNISKEKFFEMKPFHWGFEFFEIFSFDKPKEERGFDVVIGNPPYGIKVETFMKDVYSVGSRDSYGVFIAASIENMLKKHGMLVYIVSDTWLTLKTHKQLREKIVNRQLKCVIRVNQDCFDATVNPCIFVLTNAPYDRGTITVADFTNISTKKETTELCRLFNNLESLVGDYNERFAVYRYLQNLVRLNSNLPIFVASPKLFQLMNDTSCQTLQKEGLEVRHIPFNNTTVELVRFGDIADIKVGLQTGDNKYYLYQNPQAHGTYRDINHYREFLLSQEELNRIVEDNILREKIIERGFHKSKDEDNFDPDLWFDGRYIVPYDKGGESDTESGWLPNYYVPTDYFIDWSTESVTRMKTLTIADRIREYNEDKEIKPHYETTTAAVIRNKEYYFKEGITFSRTGYYCPTFRFNSKGPFDTEGSVIFFKDEFPIDFEIAVLCSKVVKYLLKNYIGHTVHTQVDELKELPILTKDDAAVVSKVRSIVTKQKVNSRYDYMGNEQKEIDQIIYKMYGLSDDDIDEVEKWYARRYPKLAQYLSVL
ncbi:MAG: N-6 DNA methylase [Candidatus Thermoplasmatota archaeon]|nr:N-6 DNA methylase [Candidatus Thermoplasmatota archaeon]MDD5778043.1 N-6 DNA methylase [Candidatus Thermoplasmatota archaeon]